MAETQSRLAEIYKAEKSKGGGIASTLGKRTLEKLDPRQFFNQKGFMAAALPSLFKSYSATPAKSGGKVSSLGSGSFSSGALENKLDVLVGETRDVKINSKISAKNSMSLPDMARDMNVMRQNITKLVKLQGGTAAKGTDMYFKKAGEREASYESQFGKEKFKTSPTKVGENKTDSKSGIFGLLGGIFSLITGAIGTIVKTAISSVGGILSSVGGVLKLLVSGVSLIVGSIGSIGQGLLNTILFLSKIRFIGKFFKAAALIGAGVGLYNILKPKKEGEEDIEDGDTSESPGVLDSITETGKDLLNQGKETFGKYGGAAAGGIAAVGAASVASKVMGAGGLAAKTGTAVLDARTMSVGQLEKSTPTSRWGKFLSFVAKKSPTLFGRIGVKLAQAGALMAIPFAGWIGAALQLGFTFWTAWELFELWREFTNSEEDEEGQNKSPTMSTTPIVEGASGAAFGMYSKPGMEPNPVPPKYNPAVDSQAANITTPTPASYSNEGRTRPTASPSSSGQSSNSSLLDIIAGGESGSMGYDAANKGKAGDMPGGYPGLSKMTVNEVMRLQSEGKVFATGRYQIIPKTLAGLMTGAYGNTGVKGGDLYDASTQDKLGTALINKRLKQGGSDPIQQQFALSQEFASIANPYTDSSYYDKVGNNKASIGTETIQAALTGTGAAPSTVVASAKSAPASSPGLTMPSVGTLAAAAPNMGDMLASASSQFSDILKFLTTASSPITNITNNNVTQASAAKSSQGNIPSVYDEAFITLFDRAVQMS